MGGVGLKDPWINFHRLQTLGEQACGDTCKALKARMRAWGSAEETKPPMDDLSTQLPSTFLVFMKFIQGSFTPTPPMDSFEGPHGPTSLCHGIGHHCAKARGISSLAQCKPSISAPFIILAFRALHLSAGACSPNDCN